LDILFTGFLVVAGLAAAVALLTFFRDRGTPGHLSFCVGFLLLSATTLLAGLSLKAVGHQEALTWHDWRFFPEALLPGIWVFFRALNFVL
jgi:hypothetical protein